MSGDDVQVVGAHLGFTNTGTSTVHRADADNPADVVRAIVDSLEAGADEALADEPTRMVRAKLLYDVLDTDLIPTANFPGNELAEVARRPTTEPPADLHPVGCVGAPSD